MRLERGVRGVEDDVLVVRQELLGGLLGHAGAVQQLALQQRQVRLERGVGWGWGRRKRREKDTLMIFYFTKGDTFTMIYIYITYYY